MYSCSLQIALGNKDAHGPDAFHMTSDKWLARFIFLESIAGLSPVNVPPHGSVLTEPCI